MSQNLISSRFTAWFDARRERIADTLAQYIALPTRTPNELCALPFLREYVASVGGTSTFLPTHPDLARHWSFSPHRYSRMSSDRGSLRCALGRSVVPSSVTTMFSCHVDVVPATPGFTQAFAPRIEDGIVWGRGACDTKNNLVMLIEAVRFLQDEGIPLTRNILLDLPIEEEIGGNGALSSLLYDNRFDEAVCLEPTSLSVFRGHRGCLTFEVTVQGVGAHMGSTAKAADAIAAAIGVIDELRGLERCLLDRSRVEPGFETSTRAVQLNIGTISGGEWFGSVPERCTLAGNLGFLPSSSLRETEESITSACRSATTRYTGIMVRTDFGTGLRNDAFMTSQDATVVRDLCRAVAASTEVEVFSTGGWNVSCDARLYAKVAGVPTVIFGSGALGDAHSPHEHVSMSELATGACILADFLSYPGDATRKVL